MTELEALNSIATSLKSIAHNMNWLSFLVFLMLLFKNMGGKNNESNS